MDDLGSRLRQAHRHISPPEPAFDRLVDRRRRKRRTSRIASLAMALVVTAAGVAGAVVALGHTGSARHGGAGLSNGGNNGPNLVASPGQYYYSKTQIYYDEYAPGETDLGTQGPWTIEMWFGTDASGRAVFVDDKAASAQSVSYGWDGPPDKTYGAGQMPLEDLSNLPTDPNELYDRLMQRSMPGGASPNPIPTSSPGRSEQDTALLRTLQDLFDEGEQYTPPAVRAAMFDVASKLDGVQTVGDETDPVGRPAIGLKWEISYQGPPSLVEWFFDPSSKQLMAETWSQDGKVIEGRVVTEAGIADSTQAAPNSENEFFPPADRAPSFLNQ